MTTKNDITGDSIQSKASGEAYRNGYGAIWGKKKREEDHSAESSNMVDNHSEDPLDMVDSDNPHIGSDASEFFELLKASLEQAVAMKEAEDREWLDAPCVGLEYGSDDYNDEESSNDR